MAAACDSSAYTANSVPQAAEIGQLGSQINSQINSDAASNKNNGLSPRDADFIYGISSSGQISLKAKSSEGQANCISNELQVVKDLVKTSDSNKNILDALRAQGAPLSVESRLLILSGLSFHSVSLASAAGALGFDSVSGASTDKRISFRDPVSGLYYVQISSAVLETATTDSKQLPEMSAHFASGFYAPYAPRTNDWLKQLVPPVAQATAKPSGSPIATLNTGASDTIIASAVGGSGAPVPQPLSVGSLKTGSDYVPFVPALTGNGSVLSTSQAIDLVTAQLKGPCRYTRKQLISLEEAQPQDGWEEHDTYASDWACLELKSHLKDDALRGCTADPKAAFGVAPAAATQIHGKVSYHFLGLPLIGFRGLSLQKNYNYQVQAAADGSLDITVKIHFTGSPLRTPGYSDQVQTKLDEAAAIWSKQSPGGKIHFHFLSVKADENPGFNVEIKPHANGDLYDTYWDSNIFTINYGHNTIAHELGHMMGIPDEYDPIRSVLWEIKDDEDTLQCNARGFMCDTYKPLSYPYYYYLILRRAACAAANP